MPEYDGPARDDPLPGRFLFNVNFVFVSTLVSNTVGFFLAILLARALGPEGRGVAALYQAAVSLGFAFFNLGIGGAAFYFVTRREISDRRALEAALTVSIIAAALTAVAVVITSLVFSGRLAEKHLPFGLAVLAVPAMIQVRVTVALLRAEGRFGAMNAIELALPLSMLVCLGGVEAVSGLTVGRTVWAWSLAYLPAVVAGYALLGRRCWPRGLASSSLMTKMVGFGVQGQLTNLVDLLNYRLDVFMILILVNTAGVGLYTVATSQTEGLWIIADSVAIVLLTNITAGDAANAARLTPVVCRNTMLVTAVGALGAAVFAPFWIPVVFGAAYEHAVAPYIWLLPGTVAISGAKVLASYVFSRGRPIINFWIALAALVITVPIELVAIHLFGVPGAAAGTSLGYCLTLGLTAAAYRALSGGSIVEALVPRRTDVGIYVDGLRALVLRLKRGRTGDARGAPEVGRPSQGASGNQ